MKEWKTRSLRLDNEVWIALQAHEMSANKLLRVALELDAASVHTSTRRPGKIEITNDPDVPHDLTVELDE